MPVCMVLVELAITCVHDYMVVNVTVTKIYGKMNFNRWVLAMTAVPTTLTSRFPTTGYARVLLYYMYKARARRNGYRMFISVCILWYWHVHKYSLLHDPWVCTIISVSDRPGPREDTCWLP